MNSWGGRPATRLRRIVIARDHGICWLCGSHGATSVDHIIPVSLGGAVWDLDNMRAAHLSCNQSRGNRVNHEPPEPPVRRTAYTPYTPKPRRPLFAIL